MIDSCADDVCETLFAHQASSAKDPSEFRRIEVKVEVGGTKAEVRTMSGDYP